MHNGTKMPMPGTETYNTVSWKINFIFFVVKLQDLTNLSVWFLHTAINIYIHVSAALPNRLLQAFLSATSGVRLSEVYLNFVLCNLAAIKKFTVSTLLVDYAHHDRTIKKYLRPSFRMLVPVNHDNMCQNLICSKAYMFSTFMLSCCYHRLSNIL